MLICTWYLVPGVNHGKASTLPAHTHEYHSGGKCKDRLVFILVYKRSLYLRPWWYTLTGQTLNRQKAINGVFIGDPRKVAAELPASKPRQNATTVRTVTKRQADYQYNSWSRILHGGGTRTRFFLLTCWSIVWYAQDTQDRQRYFVRTVRPSNQCQPDYRTASTTVVQYHRIRHFITQQQYVTYIHIMHTVFS